LRSTVPASLLPPFGHFFFLSPCSLNIFNRDQNHLQSHFDTAISIRYIPVSQLILRNRIPTPLLFSTPLPSLGPKTVVLRTKRDYDSQTSINGVRSLISFWPLLAPPSSVRKRFSFEGFLFPFVSFPLDNQKVISKPRESPDVKLRWPSRVSFNCRAGCKNSPSPNDRVPPPGICLPCHPGPTSWVSRHNSPLDPILSLPKEFFLNIFS